ncbi:MAG TPA: EF-hand domain-containing protein [Sphingomonas sp.]|nr:EF-hand domain-containing protein [Sphingomonas sp.]
MVRYLAGVASELPLVAAGFFLWTGLARREGSVPAAPPQAAPSSSAVAADVAAVIDPLQASERTREQKRFDHYDHNRGGKVDRDEYLLNRRKAFAKLDTGGDSKLSFDEYSAKAIGKFAKADADRSGALNAAEFATTRVQRKPKPKCLPAPPQAPAGDDEG